MTDEQKPQTEPTPEQVEGAQAVAAATAEAAGGAANADEAREAGMRAARESADAAKIELSDEDCQRMVNMFVDALEQRGAFDPPPEPIAPPPSPAIPAPEAPGAGTPPEAAPEGQGFADRFLHGRR